jgi:flavin reductase
MSDTDLFRQAFRRYATTVAVLTYQDSTDAACGMTATSICSLSASPPSLLVCINKETRAHAEIMGRGSFGVNLLSVEQRPIALHCSRTGGDKHLHPDWLAEDVSSGATPRLIGALAHLELQIDRTYEAYSHTMFLGLIQSVWLNPVDAPPLLYHGGTYGQLETAAERTERFHWELRAD